MRTSSLITISLSPAIASATDRVARKKHMTRSELFRAAIRNFLEENQLEEALRAAESDLCSGGARVLSRGGLAKLMRS